MQGKISVKKFAVLNPFTKILASHSLDVLRMLILGKETPVWVSHLS